MMRMMRPLCPIALIASLLLAPAASADELAEPPAAARGAAVCSAALVGVQVLGSGGPIAEGSRAGASYAVWVEGKARLLIDAGPGSFIRFGEAGLKVADLSAIAISHFHADHSAGLGGILNTGSFEQTTRPLVFVGPAGDDIFPGPDAFLSALVDRSDGAWRYLGGYRDGSDGRRLIQPIAVAAAETETPSTEPIDIGDGITLIAIPVHHGGVPALAYRVEARGRTLVFAGDQSAFSQGFDTATRSLQPELLIAHHAIPDGEGQPIGLHRPPSGIGAMAAAINPRRLVLAHNMRRAINRLQDSLASIADHYSGTVSVAEDGDCFPV